MKTKRTLSLILTFIIVLTSLTLFGITAVGAASGVTEVDTEAEFLAMTNGNYKLTKDITLSATLSSFTGTLDGGGHTVTVSKPVFSSASGSIANLTLVGNITADGSAAVGALANTVSGDLSLENITNKTNVTASGATGVGGFIGSVSGTHTVTVKNAKNEGNIAGRADVGGFIGFVKGASSSSHATVTVTNSINTGDASMTLSAKDHGVGGFIGAATFYTIEITYSVNEGDISYTGGDSGVAGFMGGSLSWNSGTTNDSFTAKYCANRGNVTMTGGSNGRMGGITGRMNRIGGCVYTYEYCYNTGAITGTAASASGITGYTNTAAKLNVVGCYNGGTLNSTLNCAIGSNNGNPGSAYVTASDNYYLGTDESSAKNIPATRCVDKATLNQKLLAIENSPYLVDPDDNGGHAILRFECKHTNTSSTCVGEICEICEENINAKVGQHSFSAWTTTTPATATEDGEKTRTCSACGETETLVIDAEGKITPAYGIYTAQNEKHILWLIANLNNETLPADIAIELGKDITLTNGNSTVTVTFTGSVNGRGYTLSGITNTLFKQLNGTLENLTLKGSIDYTKTTNNKAASVAMNGQDVIIRNVVSEVNVKSKGGNANIGGILGYGKGSVILWNVVYAGDLEMDWTSQNAGIGGIVGWINTNNTTSAIENCRFTGKMTVTVNSTGDLDVGGIVGHAGSSSAAGEVIGCVNTGAIKVNESTSEKIYVGGIVGKFNDNDKSYIKRCVVNGTVTLPEKANYSSLLGRVTNKTGYLLENCAVLNDTAAWCTSDAVTVINCHNKNTVKKIGNPFTRNGVSYQKYNFGYLNTETLQCVDPASIPAAPFGKGTIEYVDSVYKITTPDFTSFISASRGKTAGTSNLRFVIAADYAVLLQNKQLFLTIAFQSEGTTVRSLKKELVKDLNVYHSAIAAGATYTAGTGDVLFGIVITDVPDTAWTSVKVTLTNEEIAVASGTTDTEFALHTSPKHFTSLKIADKPISDYTIVYAESEFDVYANVSSLAPLYTHYDFNRETAERLSDLIYYVTGERLAVVKDEDTKETACEILVGITNRYAVSTSLSLDTLTSDQYLIDTEGTKLVICGGEYGTTWHAIDYLEKLFSDTINSGTLTFSFGKNYSYEGEYRLTRIGCIGDSITQGTGSSNQALYSYPAQLGRLLWKDAIVQNYGRSGSTMRTDLADAYTKRVAYTNAVNAAKDTDIFIIMLGTNDSNRDQNWNDTSSTKYNNSCLTIVKSLADKNSDLQFVLANCPTYFGDRAFGSETVRNLQAALVKTLNDKGYPTTFFDMHEATADLGEYFPDDLHPNNMGYRYLAEAFKTCLDPLIKNEVK